MKFYKEMYKILQKKEGYELLKGEKVIKTYKLKIFEQHCNNLGILEMLDYIKKEENLPFLDLNQRLIKIKGKY